MSAFDFFPYVWLGVVAFMGLTLLAWTVYEFRRGVAQWGWIGAKFARDDEPFYFWMLLIGRFAGFLLACFMFWAGLDMLKW